MFLRSLELISTFNPNLSAGRLLQLERRMAVAKKRSFEPWLERALPGRRPQEQRQCRQSLHQRFLQRWSPWLSLDCTRQALPADCSSAAC